VDRELSAADHVSATAFFYFFFFNFISHPIFPLSLFGHIAAHICHTQFTAVHCLRLDNLGGLSRGLSSSDIVNMDIPGGKVIPGYSVALSYMEVSAMMGTLGPR